MYGGASEHRPDNRGVGLGGRQLRRGWSGDLTGEKDGQGTKGEVCQLCKDRARVLERNVNAPKAGMAATFFHCAAFRLPVWLAATDSERIERIGVCVVVGLDLMGARQERNASRPAGVDG